jgi:hypothetical protein
MYLKVDAKICFPDISTFHLRTIIVFTYFLDPTLSRFVEQKISIQLTNQWISDYNDPTSAGYITLITAIDLAVSISFKINQWLCRVEYFIYNKYINKCNKTAQMPGDIL